MLSWPPISAAASNRCTACPRSASSVAAVSPAGPAPTTAKVRRLAVGWNTSSVSWQARGLTRQLVSLFTKMWSRQAWLHAMQVLIACGVPRAAFFTKSGSASSGRAIDTKSATPSASSCSATSGVLMRLLVTSGIFTSPIIFLVTHAHAARGTLVAMVGTRASCQPMPVLMMVAPAASMALASCTTSSHELPSGTRSIIDSR